MHTYSWITMQSKMDETLSAMQTCYSFMPNTLNKDSWHLSESLKDLTCSWALTRISSPGCGSRRPACRPSVCPPRCPGVWGWWNSDDDIDDDDYLDCDVVQEAGARVEAECDEASVGEVGDAGLIRGVIVPSVWWWKFLGLLRPLIGCLLYACI